MKLNPKLVLDLMHPVGSYYETSNASFNPNTAWGGTWVREDDGTTLVSYKSSGAFNKTIGTIVGEETHTLTKSELPQIDIQTNYGTPDQGGGAGNGLQFCSKAGNSNNLLVQNVNFGENPSHNNVQPSKVAYRWHRTA